MMKCFTRLIILLIICGWTTLCFAASGFAVIQDGGTDDKGKPLPGVLKPGTAQKMQEIISPLQKEHPNYEFHLVLAPNEEKRDMKSIRNDVFRNYIDVDRRITTVFLIVRTADCEYQYIIDDSLKNKIAPQLLERLADDLTTKIKAGQADKGVIDNVPRMAGYFAEIQKIPFQKSQQELTGAPNRPDRFVYAKPDIEKAEVSKAEQPQQQSKIPKTIWIFLILGIPVLVAGGYFAWKQYEKRQIEEAYEDGADYYEDEYEEENDRPRN